MAAPVGGIVGADTAVGDGAVVSVALGTAICVGTDVLAGTGEAPPTVGLGSGVTAGTAVG